MTAFVAPGAGRCGYHATERERVRVLAERRAVRELRELRALPAAERCEDQDEARCDEGPVGDGELDAERFASAALDE